MHCPLRFDLHNSAHAHWTAAQLNQFDIRVNGAAPDGGAIVFGGTANQPNAGTAILTLSAGDIVTLENLTSTGFVPPPALNALGAPALLEGDVTLAAQTGGTASSVNASIVIEQLNAPLARE